tara:strand:+ start:7908 stop:8174 length:267 start_codon:yes stop_codon:yes gene_type:complete
MTLYEVRREFTGSDWSECECSALGREYFASLASARAARRALLAEGCWVADIFKVTTPRPSKSLILRCLNGRGWVVASVLDPRESGTAG